MSFTGYVESIDRAVQTHLGGVTVVYRPEDGDPVEVEGIFDERYILLEPGNPGVEQVTPAVWLRLEDLPVHPDDDEPLLTIDDKFYRVRERQTDGSTGGTILLLLHRELGE